MIKLTLPDPPKELTPEKVRALTEEYLLTGKEVWKQTYIAEHLLKMTHSKCAYSECKLREEGKYPETDHFYPKKYYPERIVQWGNLLPVSNVCNRSKGTHDPNVDPIINPLVDDPRDHLSFIQYRFKGKTELGKQTIEVVDLNNIEHFGKKRFELGEGLVEQLCNLAEKLENNRETLTERQAAKFKRQLLRIMGVCTRENHYAAAMSTVILTDASFSEIEHYLKENGLWDSNLQSIKEELLAIALLPE